MSKVRRVREVRRVIWVSKVSAQKLLNPAGRGKCYMSKKLKNINFQILSRVNRQRTKYLSLIGSSE